MSATMSRSKKLLRSVLRMRDKMWSEVPSTRNMTLLEDLISRPLLGVVGHEPAGTQGDDSRRGSQLSGGVAFQSSIELGRLDQIGRERHCSLRRHVVKGIEGRSER